MVGQWPQGICPSNASECLASVEPLTHGESLTASKAFGGRDGKIYFPVTVIGSIGWPIGVAAEVRGF